MENNSILLIGDGQCGCNQVYEIKKKNKKVHALYVNSSKRDLDCLEETPNNTLNKLIFVSNDGSGRQRSVAQSYLMRDENTNGLDSKLKGFSQQKMVFVFTSAGGGTGSGTALMICAWLLRTRPDMIVNLVVTLPFKRESNTIFENTVSFWNDLIDARDDKSDSYLPNLHSIYLVDNSKRNTAEEINEELANAFNSLFNMTDSSKSGSFDETDSEKLLSANGLCGIYDFDLPDTDLIEYVSELMEDSIFVVKSKFFEYIGLKTDEQFDYDDEEEFFDVFKGKLDKYVVRTRGTNKSLLLLAGSRINSNVISKVQKTLLRKNKDNERIEAEELEDDAIDKKVRIEKKIAKPKKITQQRVDIDEILENGTQDFWNKILNN